LHESTFICKTADAAWSADTDSLLTDEDGVYDLGLGKFGIDVEEHHRILISWKSLSWMARRMGNWSAEKK
jgi:hypothetical protein